MLDKIKIIPLGGLDDSGRDCYVIEINNDIFVLECGYSLPDKTLPGVDFMLPNVEYLIVNKDRVRAYILTHGHDENMGALQYYFDYAPAPIYCSKATKIIAESEAQRFGLKPHWSFNVVGPSDVVNIAGRKISFFQTTHNASYSFGVAIETNRGNIIYTGDYIIDFTSQEAGYRFDLAALEEIAKKPTYLLLSESKGASKEGYCAPNHNIYPRVSKIFSDSHKRIFITCFWQNFYRINEICQLVKNNHKKIYFYNDYTRNVMNELMKADHSICLEPGDIIQKEDLLRNRNEDVVILLLGRGAKLYEEFTKIVNRTNEDKRIVLGKDDIFINVAIPTPNLEILATRCMDTLYRNECQVVWIKPKEIASMHARVNDLKFFLSMLKPKFYFPVRGSFVNLMANAKLALSMNIGLNHTNVFVLDNGMTLEFDEFDKPKITPNEVNHINVAPVLVDGLGVSLVPDMVINERRRLGQDGVIVIAATVSRSEKRIVSGPDCQMRGFVFVKEAEPLLKSVSKIFEEEVLKALRNNTMNYDETIALIKDRSKKFIRRENGREPLVMPIIIPVN